MLTLRLPRVLAGLLSGAALAIAGAIMQAVTNNPLASPGLLGINAGAAFAVVMAIDPDRRQLERHTCLVCVRRRGAGGGRRLFGRLGRSRPAQRR